MIVKGSLSSVEKIIALILIILTSPVLLCLFITFKMLSSDSFLFKQKRLGKNNKTFEIYKIRTMVGGAEDFKKKYLNMNEADGPVFKIRDDPRYTQIGKIISRLGLDELPQLMNVLKGEMAFVGPRPLPLEEAKQIPKLYEKRFSVLPGITSLWVVEGGHSLSFKKWMELDVCYVSQKSLFLDCLIILKTMKLFLKVIFKGKILMW